MILSRGARRRFNAYLLLSPSTATLALVAVFPILYVVYLSFSGFYYGNRTGFVGFRNYVNILTDPNFYSSLKATFIFMAGSVVGQLVLALIFALIISHSRRLESGVRLVAILPYMVSMVAGGVTFRWLLNTEFGLVNSVLLSFGVTKQPINFLGEPLYAMASIIGAHLWSSIPLATLILLAGMKSISTDVYESAEIDGAGFFTKFFCKTMFSFRHFPLPYAMTGGGPGVSTKVLAMLLQEKMTFLAFGYNSALSVIMMLITLAIAFFYLKLMTAERG
jgi:multiple sugar transport system permease protein